MRTALSIAVGMALALAAPAAFAQDTTTGTAGAGGTATAEGTLPPPKVVTKTVEPTTAAPAKKVEEDEVSDHEKVVGHIGVGYLGLTTLPLAPGNGIPATVSAPVIGVRYWLAEKIGLDLGLGFGLTFGLDRGGRRRSDAHHRSAERLRRRRCTAASRSCSPTRSTTNSCSSPS